MTTQQPAARAARCSCRESMETANLDETLAHELGNPTSDFHHHYAGEVPAGTR